MKTVYAKRMYDSAGREILRDHPKQTFSKRSWDTIPPMMIGAGDNTKKVPKQGWEQISEAEFHGLNVAAPAEVQTPPEAKAVETSNLMSKSTAKRRIKALKDGKQVSASDLLEAVKVLGYHIDGIESMSLSEMKKAIKEL